MTTGILLAGGTGSRLKPLTKVTNKHLLGVGLKPMINYSLRQFQQMGFNQVIVVTGKEHAGHIIQYIGDGSDYNFKVAYVVQEHPGGIGHAIGLCKNFVGKGDPIAVLLGDNIFMDDLADYYECFSSFYGAKGAFCLLKEVDTPERYGVATVKDEMIIKIAEKPKKPESNLAVTGCYFFDEKVWKIIKTLKPSGRGEIEVTDILNHYIKMEWLHWDKLQEPWTDAGTPESYKKANLMMWEEEICQ